MKTDKPFSFDRRYLEYWQERSERASDGTRVPGLGVAAALIDHLEIQRGDRVLDVGCGFGRLIPVLAPHTDAIFGLEMSYDIVDAASRSGYQCVVRGGAEDSNLPSGFFSHLILFGVFDCCDQPKTLHETRRLLVPNGRALLTGKNANYHDDDLPALIAERNAWRKSFPNSFTYASRMANDLPAYGLDLVELLRFPRRGDFGDLRKLSGEASSDTAFYEYAAIVQASETLTQSRESDISTRISQTAQRVACARGFANVEEFFHSPSLDRPTP